MSKDDLYFRLRIPDDLKSLVAASSVDNNRSISAEIIFRLRESFDDEQAGRGTKLAEINSKLDRILGIIDPGSASSPPSE